MMIVFQFTYFQYVFSHFTVTVSCIHGSRDQQIDVQQVIDSEILRDKYIGIAFDLRELKIFNCTDNLNI